VERRLKEDVKGGTQAIGGWSKYKRESKVQQNVIRNRQKVGYKKTVSVKYRK
jgi:hypothetical protein